MSRLILLLFCTTAPLLVVAQNVGIGTNVPQTKLSVAGGISSIPAYGYSDSLVVIPSNVSVYFLFPSSGYKNNQLQLDTPSDGHFLTLVNGDNDTAWFDGNYILPFHAVSFLYLWPKWFVTSGSTTAATAGNLDNAYNFGGLGSGRVINANNGAVTIRGTDGLDITGTLGTGDTIAAFTGPRMFFNPRKAAFRAGNDEFGWSTDSVIGENSIALGHNVLASGSNAVALGAITTAGNEYATALGTGAFAYGKTSLAFTGGIANGEKSIAAQGGTANAFYGTAIGLGTIANGNYSTVFGFDAQSNGEASFAAGLSSNASGSGSIALGNNATAIGSNSIASSFSHAVGDASLAASGATANGQASIAMGTDAYADAANGVAIGASSRAIGGNAIAIGQSTANGLSSIALGIGAVANGQGSTALSWGQANGINSLAAANGTSSGVYSVALGSSATAAGNYSIALGLNASANAQASVALGNGAVASAQDALALCMGSAWGLNSFAFGQNAAAANIQSIALGYNAQSTAPFSIAFTNCQANGQWAFAAGKYSIANGESSVAIGISAIAGGTNSFALSNSTASGNSSFAAAGGTASDNMAIAIGTNALASKPGTTAMGPDSKAQGLTSMALGSGSKSSGFEATAIGHGTATADYALAVGYSTASNTYCSAVGYNALAKAIYSTALTNSVAEGSASLAAVGGHTYGDMSVAMGAGTQAVGSSSVAIGLNAKANASGSIALGPNTADQPNATSLGNYCLSSGVGSNTFGYGLTASSFYETALGTYNEVLGGHKSSWVATEPLLVVGGGSNSTTRQNVLTILKNGNVGIGSTAPAVKLEVAGKTLTTDFQMTTGAGTGKVLTSDAAGNATWQTVATEATTASNGLSLIGTDVQLGGTLTANTNIANAGYNLNINGTGNVGIGNNAPDAKLVVGSGSVSTEQSLKVISAADATIKLIADDDNVTESDNPSLFISQDGGLVTGLLGFTGNTANIEPVADAAYTDALTNTLLIGTLTQHSIQLGTYSNARLTIRDNGNVGVGTNNPGALLDVNGNFSLGATGSTLNAIIKTTATTTSQTIAANTTAVQTYTATNAVTGSTAMVSPASAINAGLVIAWCRVSAANTVEVAYRNTTGSSITLTAGITLYLTTIQ